jgi:hypothetical protein
MRRYALNPDHRSTQHQNGEAGQLTLKPGTLVRIKHCANEYRLPTGIKPGDLVKILGFDHGYYAVEQGGRTFSVFMTNIIRP